MRGSVKSLPERVSSRIHVVGECWMWTGGKQSRGYGVVTSNGKTVLAHRFVYEQLVGPIVSEVLDHLCNTPLCVNPAHLNPTTRKANILRGKGYRPDKAAQTHCLRGHEFTPENTVRNHEGRNCRECHRSQLRLRRGIPGPRRHNKPFCKRGHSLVDAIVRLNGDVECRTCHNNQVRERRKSCRVS